jgi:predicted dehydrogenase
MSDNKITRRGFLARAAATAAGTAFLMGRAPAQISTASPNEKLNVAGIGVGGKGHGEVMHCAATENIVALCDVDDVRAAKAFEAFPNAKKYRDYRKMLEEVKEIDAVTISTPDHMHFPQAMMAMALGKHVYVQKPLTHTVAEARMITEAARKYKVQTQMGNQGHSGDGVRQLCELIWSGVIGPVREVHTWTDRPIWPQGMTEPYPEKPVPETLDWELWQGVAPRRPFGGYWETDQAGYVPFVWRGFWDYGCGALGDMACHIMDPPNWALHLYESAPTSVEVVKQEGHNPLTAPTMSTIKYEFPARGDQPPVTLYWYDGFADPSNPKDTQNFPPRPEGVGPDVKLGSGRNGSIFIGEKGIITANTYGENPRLLPEEKMKDFTFPDETLPRIHIGDDPKKWEDEDYMHKQDWIRAIKGGPAPCSNFDYAGPFTEYVVLGNLALRANARIEWDAKNMKITNLPEANQWIGKEYPEGWGA